MSRDDRRSYRRSPTLAKSLKSKTKSARKRKTQTKAGIAGKRSDSKQARLKMLKGPDGATIDEIPAAYGQPDFSGLCGRAGSLHLNCACHRRRARELMGEGRVLVHHDGQARLPRVCYLGDHLQRPAKARSLRSRAGRSSQTKTSMSRGRISWQRRRPCGNVSAWYRADLQAHGIAS